MTARRTRIGWLAPEDASLPLERRRGSISNDIAQLTARLAGELDILVATGPHPTLGSADMTADGLRYTRAHSPSDHVRDEWFGRLNQLQRRLGLADLPYAGRPSYYSGYARAHARRFRQERVDVVHFHNNSQWAPILRAELPDAALVLQMHSEWLNEVPYGDGLARLKAVDRVLAVSAHVADQIRSRYPLLAGKVGVLRNGVDVSEFPSCERIRAEQADEVDALRRSLGIRGRRVILFVGRISAEKSLHVLLEALPRVLACVPEAAVVLAGGFGALRSPLATRDRPELAEHPSWRARYAGHVQALARPFGDRVVFAGHVPAVDLPLLYALADVVAHPSMFEAFPLAVVEAMASAVPVVAAAVGGIPEQVVDGRTGLLVPYGDRTALADALVRVLGDEGLARTLGRAGREHAARHLDWDAPAAQLRLEFERLVERSSVRRNTAAVALPISRQSSVSARASAFAPRRRASARSDAAETSASASEPPSPAL